MVYARARRTVVSRPSAGLNAIPTEFDAESPGFAAAPSQTDSIAPLGHATSAIPSSRAPSCAAQQTSTD